MHRIGRPAKALRIGKLEHQLDFILALHQLALGMVVQAGTYSVFRAQVAEVVIVFTSHPQVFPHQHFIRPTPREDHQLGRAEVLEKGAGFAC